MPLRARYFSKRRDILETLAPDGLRHQFRWNPLLRQNFGVHANDQQFFIIGRLKMPMRPRSGRLIELRHMKS